MPTNAEIESVVQQIVDEVFVPRFNELGMNATGQWLKTVDAKDNTIIGQDYTQYLADGRGAGKPPPIDPLEKWVEAKMGIHGKQATSIAFAISKTIAKEGTSWHQKGGTDLLKILESPEVLKMFTERISVFYINDVKNQYLKIFKE